MRTLILLALLSIPAAAQIGGGGGGGSALARNVLVLQQVPDPVAALTATATGTVGNPSGTYYYFVTFVTAYGDTAWGPASAPVTTTLHQISLSGIPVSSDSRVTGRKIYRGASADPTSTGSYIVATIANNTDSTYTDNAVNGTLYYTQGAGNHTAAILLGTEPVFQVAKWTAFSENALYDGDVSIGYNTPNFPSTSAYIGADAGAATLPGSARNVGIGSAAMGWATLTKAVILDTTGVGDGVFYNGIGNRAVALGSSAGARGNDSTCVGYYACFGFNSGAGQQNTMIGSQTDWDGPLNGSGSANVGLGYQAFDVLANGSTNIAIGAWSAAKIVNGSGNVIIGDHAGPTAADVSNKLYVHNSQSDTPLIAGDFSAGTVFLNARVGATLHTPASSSETCTAGQWADDANFHYVCVTTNTWKRAGLSSF